MLSGLLSGGRTVLAATAPSHPVRTLQVGMLVEHGPKELHLADLQDIKLVYKRIKVIDEKDKDASTSANKLGEAEGGKIATTSSSDRLEADDMETDARTHDDSLLTASTSNSSPGSAAAAAAAIAATATATAAPTLGLRRSTRLAPKL
ncbi:hypothetical protein RHOSPDRAFT_37347 [Rhodotorula sp. JG-1b]|nr:hypothetical protein RHOSPDRAFT_37347 [Rhodotorula sp. JG-1b]